MVSNIKKKSHKIILFPCSNSYLHFLIQNITLKISALKSCTNNFCRRGKIPQKIHSLINVPEVAKSMQLITGNLAWNRLLHSCRLQKNTFLHH